jgi:hypothetical protein
MFRRVSPLRFDLRFAAYSRPQRQRYADITGELMITKPLLPIAVVFGLWACATAPVTSDRLPETEAPIRAAAELGAARVPQAALQLKLAQDELEQAKLLLKDGNKPRAEMMLLRAQADAELAVALAKEAPLQADAKNAAEQVKAMQQ